uniref:SGNH hydrolase-type esterase domain-containing protein n=1 Tax=Haptolina brevifila TaxID=156173 RepID=A0A7S2IFL5_9EUKA|mmetsp:Transcript_6556/g.13582  ORF Transcript_6556/g.13582 Transcript_6556/m.13582 type:complete len:405 (+) Transcript_6556:169-1383(+)|eukprot:CAMPEP_0174722096 /NCGR_PEP_ID=MMETSP1094-20130205/37616_1 /TAXON_ID=156173 /ORGANISM="Chrysochromulina brevifilum, Strain UTEX LB 985" /LENGTH=404 /DNA_ID=CAMNT_0015922887 /DNA_START=102 /DNA_END=1316 /DNA_ORIENTATION=+
MAYLSNDFEAFQSFQSTIEHAISDLFEKLPLCGATRKAAGNLKRLAKQLQPIRPVRPVIMLLGDSITQQAFLPGQWGGPLAAHYARTADIVLRGYAGYNSRWLKALVPAILQAGQAPALVILLVGTNDSVRTGNGVSSRQHVPVQEYVSNMIDIVQILRSYGDGRVCVLLMTPPPIADGKRVKYERRSAEDTALWADDLLVSYVKMCRLTAVTAEVPLIDLHKEFKQRAGWQELLSEDGMHPNSEGGALIAQLVLEGIARHAPHLQPASAEEYWRKGDSTPAGRLPLDFPAHLHLDTSDLAHSLEQHRLQANLHVKAASAAMWAVGKFATAVADSGKGEGSTSSGTRNTGPSRSGADTGVAASVPQPTAIWRTESRASPAEPGREDARTNDGVEPESSSEIAMF